MKKLSYFILNQDWKKLFAFLLIGWLGLNFFQAICTEIMNDEAYYFLYGQNLAWGYFDHPPMVGLMTFISSYFFNGNLSVRFMTVVIQFFTLVLLWKLIDEQKPDARKVALFFIISASLVMFQAYGFVTTPDAPLLFFTALFLLFYRNFLKQSSWFNTLMLAVSMTGMIYSKYHAILIIGCIVLSNWRLLIQSKFWMAVLVTALCMIPHVYWQITMGFPSFQYHLSDRTRSFKWGYLLEYIPNQLVVFNPFTFGAVVYVLIKHKARDVFERGLYVLTVGLIAFFWLMSFRGHVEPHWTVVCTIPIIVLLYHNSLFDKKLMRFLKCWILPSLILVFCVRLVLVTDLLPKRLDFHGKNDKNKAIESVAGDLPVVFAGVSFQNPSTYHFFTGNESFVLSSMNSRQTQFDILQKELNYHGKPVFICQQKEGRSEDYHINGYFFSGYYATDFQSVNRIKINFSPECREVFKGDTLRIDFEIVNPTQHTIRFQHSEFPVTCKAVYALNVKNAKNVIKKEFHYFHCDFDSEIDELPPYSTIAGSLQTVVPDINPGVYPFALTLDNTVCCAKNSDLSALTVRERQ